MNGCDLDLQLVSQPASRNLGWGLPGFQTQRGGFCLRSSTCWEQRYDPADEVEGGCEW